MAEKLLIKAETIEECDLISALVQDSLFHMSYHSFHEDRKCLRLMINRFCWELEKDNEQHQCYFRVHSGLYIHGVESIIVNDSFKHSTGYLNLLAMHASEHEINLIFSDHKHVCINISKILVYLKDLHDVYPTMAKPCHECLNP